MATSHEPRGVRYRGQKSSSDSETRSVRKVDFRELATIYGRPELRDLRSVEGGVAALLWRHSYQSGFWTWKDICMDNHFFRMRLVGISRIV